MSASSGKPGIRRCGRPDRGLARLSAGLAGERARPSRDRRLRRGRAGRGVRHPRLSLRRGGHPRRAPREYLRAFAERTDDFEVLYASKALPCTAAFRIMREEGLSVDVASGGELHLALAAGYDPARIHVHGNNKTEAELRYALDAGVGHLIVDSFDEIDRLERLLDRPQRVLIRITPGIEAHTHDYMQTGQVDSKFGFGLADGLAERAVERGARQLATSSWSGCTPTSARRSSSSSPTSRRSRCSANSPAPSTSSRSCSTSAAGSASPTLDDGRGALDRGLRGRQGPRRGEGVRPGAADPGGARPLDRRQRRGHRLSGRHRQGDPRRPDLRRRGRRHVGQPAADALRLPLRGRDRRSRRRRRRTPR